MSHGSHDARVTLDWGDGEHVFRLAFGRVVELEDKLKVPLYEMMQQALRSRLPAGHAREVLRLGLIGGGSTPAEALRLVRLYCEERPLLESMEPALRVLEAALLGPEGQNAGKPSGGAEPTAAPTGASQMAGAPAASPSPGSTAAAP